MIEIINENRISAEKIFRDTNEEEQFYLMELIARERPALALRAVTEAVANREKRDKAMEELASRKYEVFV